MNVLCMEFTWWLVDEIFCVELMECGNLVVCRAPSADVKNSYTSVKPLSKDT